VSGLSGELSASLICIFLCQIAVKKQRQPKIKEFI